VIVRRAAKDTLTAVEMMHGDVLEFRLLSGATVRIELVHTGAEIMETNLKQPGVEERAGRTTYRFWAELAIDGNPARLEREVGTQKSFYEPWRIAGVTIWLDAVEAIFEFMREMHGPCLLQENCSHHSPPRRHGRLAVQDASARICPEKVHPWCPLPEEGLRIENCYRGEDCWLGAYHGASTHAGLDINHPKGTPLYAPIDLDDQFLCNSLEMGSRNNGWRGIRRWPNGAQWVLASGHMTHLTIPEHTPLAGGRQYAEGAGTFVGHAEHSHFGFAVFDGVELIRLDPWILFWQMYQDRTAHMAVDAPQPSSRE